MDIPTKKVIIVGAGIGGLSAAHELVGLNRRQHQVRFDVALHERTQVVGGKAASQWPTVRDAEGHAVALPAEHGFRFFPHFYRHMTQTLREIEIPEDLSYDRKARVFDRLVPSKEAGLADGGEVYKVSRPTPAAREAFKQMAENIGKGLTLPVRDCARYALHILKFLTSSDERRLQEFDQISWRDYLQVDKENYSEQFMKLVVMGSVNLSAMKADEGSARTIGNISMQMLFDFAPEDPYHPADAVLNAPTDRSLLQPWRRYLEDRGASFRFGRELIGLELAANGRIARLKFEGDAAPTEVGDASVILAIPIEAVLPLISGDLADYDGNLADLRELGTRSPTRPMVGAQFFLRDRLDLADGHMTFPKSPYALTAVAQSKFWLHELERADLHKVGVHESLSVIASLWDDAPAGVTKAQDQPDEDALLDEIWSQMKLALGDRLPAKEEVAHRHLDANVRVGDGKLQNDTPLLVHPLGGYALRPPARTGIANLYLAADYVRTNTDLASMESANEAAREAVRAIAQTYELSEDLMPRVWKFDEGEWFASAKKLDAVLVAAKLPHIMDIVNPPYWVRRLRSALLDKGLRPSFDTDDKVIDKDGMKIVGQLVDDPATLIADLFEEEERDLVMKGLQRVAHTVKAQQGQSDQQQLEAWVDTLIDDVSPASPTPAS